MSFIEARNRAITEEMTEDRRTILFGGMSGPGSPEGGFAQAFGRDRVRSIPISEEGYGGAAVGAAMAGLRPIVSFSTGSFMYNAWEPVVNEAALMRYMSGGQMSVPITFHFYVGLRPGAAAQHSQSPQAMLCNAPGLVAADEGRLTCGISSEIVATVSELGHDLLKSAPRRVGVPDVPSPMAPALDAAITPSEDRLEQAIRATLG